MLSTQLVLAGFWDRIWQEGTNMVLATLHKVNMKNRILNKGIAVLQSPRYMCESMQERPPKIFTGRL
jgi:hypothetical protein